MTRFIREDQMEDRMEDSGLRKRGERTSEQGRVKRDRLGLGFTEDYFPNWKLSENEQKLYESIADQPLYGLINRGDVSPLNAVKDWAGTRKEALTAASWAGTPKAIAKFAVNDTIDPFAMGVNTWRPKNWTWEATRNIRDEAGNIIGEETYDVAESVRDWTNKKTGSQTAGKVAKVITHVPGKLLHTLPLAFTAFDATSRLQSGESLARTGVGVTGSLVGGGIGGAIGATFLGPVGYIGGSMIGSMIGDNLATNVYGAITGDKGPQENTQEGITALQYQEAIDSANRNFTIDEARRQAQIERIRNIRQSNEALIDQAMKLSQQYGAY